MKTMQAILTEDMGRIYIFPMKKHEHLLGGLMVGV